MTKEPLNSLSCHASAYINTHTYTWLYLSTLTQWQILQKSNKPLLFRESSAYFHSYTHPYTHMYTWTHIKNVWKIDNLLNNLVLQTKNQKSKKKKQKETRNKNNAFKNRKENEKKIKRIFMTKETKVIFAFMILLL